MTNPTRTQVEKAAREMYEVARDAHKDVTNPIPPWSNADRESKPLMRAIARWHLARVAEGDVDMLTFLCEENDSLRKQLAAKSPATKAKKERGR